MNAKTRKIVGWVLTALITAALVGSATMKLMGGAGTDEGAVATGLAENIKLVAVVELICATLFIIPRTGLLGTLLLAAYLGGAIATHLVQSQPFIAPMILQCLVWITATIRFPELSRRLVSAQEFA